MCRYEEKLKTWIQYNPGRWTDRLTDVLNKYGEERKNKRSKMTNVFFLMEDKGEGGNAGTELKTVMPQNQLSVTSDQEKKNGRNYILKH